MGRRFCLGDSALGPHRATGTPVVSRRWPSVTERFAITAAAGLIAGESITGVGASLWEMLKGL